MSLSVPPPVRPAAVPVPLWAVRPPRALSARRPGPPPVQRVGDRERSLVCEQLSQHYSEGRLDADELEDRLSEAMGARTEADLWRLTQDLPAVPAGPPAPARTHSRSSAVVATLVLVASLAVCLLMILGSLLVSPGWAFGAVLGGSVAAVGGIAIGHLWSLRR